MSTTRKPTAEQNLAREAAIAWQSAIIAPIVEHDELLGRELVDYDGSVLVVGEPVPESYLDGYRVLRNRDGEELDQSYHETYLATLPVVAN